MLSRLEVVTELRRMIAKLERGSAPRVVPPPPSRGDLEPTAAGNYVAHHRAAAPTLRPGGLTAALAGQSASLERVCVLDTETTGLAGGTGTLAFLVGVATVERGSVTVRQFVLGSPAKEGALLDDMLAAMAGATLMVTFTGRSFDLPLLRTRLTMNRRNPAALDGLPHLDLLGPARHLWRKRTGNCRLLTLESEILKRPRHDDLPGSQAPAAYAAYLRSRDLRQLTAIVRHNRDDLLGTLALTAQALRVLDSPAEEAEDAGELAGAETLWKRAVG